VSVMAMLRQYASNDSLIRVEVETLSNL